MTTPTAPSEIAPRSLKIGVFILLVLIWGSTWFAIKVGLESFPPMFALAVRFLIAGPTFLVIMRLRGLPIPLTPRNLPYFLTLAVLSFVTSFGVVYWGEQYVTSGLTAVIFAMLPLMTAVASLWLLKSERLTPMRLVGVALGLAGMVVIHSGDLKQVHPMAPLAAVLLLISPAVTAVSTILTKKRVKEFHTFALAGIPMTIGGILDLGLWALLERHEPMHVTWPGVLSIAYLAVIGSLVTFSGYNWLLKHVEVSRVNLLSYLTPIVALTIGAIFLDEPITLTIALGATLVIAGTAAAGIGKGLRPRKRAPAAGSARGSAG